MREPIWSGCGAYRKVCQESLPDSRGRNHIHRKNLRGGKKGAVERWPARDLRNFEIQSLRPCATGPPVLRPGRRKTGPLLTAEVHILVQICSAVSSFSGHTPCGHASPVASENRKKIFVNETQRLSAAN